MMTKTIFVLLLSCVLLDCLGQHHISIERDSSLINSSWQVTAVHSFTYNDHCRQTERRIDNFDFFNPTVVNYVDHAYTLYDQFQRDTMGFSLIETLGSVDTSSIYKKTYNSFGQLLFESSFFNSNLSYIQSYEYPEDSIIVKIKDNYCSEGICNHYSRTTTVTDINEHVLKVTEELWSGATESWNLSSRHLYSYQGENLTSTLKQNFDNELGVWVNANLYSQTFNDDGLAQYISYSWNVSGENWQPVTKIDYTYDGGKLVYRLQKNAVGCCNWTNNSEVFYSYTDGLKTSLLQHYFPDNSYTKLSWEYTTCSLLGDIDMDFDIDTSDLLLILENFGCFTCTEYDLSANGIIDANDVQILLSLLEN